MSVHSRSMFYVFVAVDADPRRLALPSAYKLATTRLRSGYWPLNAGTRNFSSLKPGDRIIAYAAGRRPSGRSFAGTATIGSYPVPTSASQRTKMLSSDPLGSQAPYTIMLRQVRVFPQPVAISSLLKELRFILAPESRYWSAPLMGGTLRIDVEDFRRIVAAAHS